ncbi:helix-turn-helix domain-containing protein [Lactiplantibacillus fabifermentans]|uniref:HTH cro/C1-type domain-containing protein n=2 Tax=Lactiplantibacillus fabifermentans TaxID=483011 RepID=A0A0R2NH05_9LACO|nr:helix-turn-helix transcriptional regulator [Lactiplantibacillus fabifermentans]ETY75398.1 hypothetical protein LFAB_02045 [Lactiplantibacillus fabifermentans T30PCM01]KRO25064.1 hypothetical protein DY78_GL001421 [Lactiplantibacillus fabifermentans DSM 21115]
MTGETREFYNDELAADGIYTAVTKWETTQVRKLTDLVVKHHYWRDQAGQLWLNFDDMMENPRADFIAYRKRKGYLTPEQLQHYRQARHLTKAALADQLDIKAQAITQLETNLRVQTDEQEVELRRILGC